MSYLKILDVNVDFLRTAARKDFMDELRHAIERKLADLDDIKAFACDKADVIRLITAIEAYKVQFVRGEISAKRLYSDVDHTLSLFRIKHPGFDYMKDPALNAYFS